MAGSTVGSSPMARRWVTGRCGGIVHGEVVALGAT
jgi:hypothetical protein